MVFIFERRVLGSFAHPHVVLNSYDYLFSSSLVEHKIIYFEECCFPLYFVQAIEVNENSDFLAFLQAN